VTDDQHADERKRYTSRLQRRAQAHVTAELGAESGGADIDRQVAMLVQHALEATGARRVTLFRPGSRGQRWHTVTVLDDGGFYYGLVAPDSLVLPMVAYVQKRPLLLGPDRPHEIPAPSLTDLGFRSYLGLPLVVGEKVVAVLEAVDVAQSDLLEGYATTLEQTMSALTEALGQDTADRPDQRPGQPSSNVADTAVLDLVLRPPVDQDDTFEVEADAWPLLIELDGERTLGDIAAAAGLPLPRASALAGSLLDRGLIRTGREDRRRG